eukprot:g21247.t1
MAASSFGSCAATTATMAISAGTSTALAMAIRRAKTTSAATVAMMHWGTHFTLNQALRRDHQVAPPGIAA